MLGIKRKKRQAESKFGCKPSHSYPKMRMFFVDACDYDIEGSIISYCILKYACGGKEKEAKRMKYSTLTKEELEKAYESLMPRIWILRL